MYPTPVNNRHSDQTHSNHGGDTYYKPAPYVAPNQDHYPRYNSGSFYQSSAPEYNLGQDNQIPVVHSNLIPNYGMPNYNNNVNPVHLNSFGNVPAPSAGVHMQNPSNPYGVPDHMQAQMQNKESYHKQSQNEYFKNADGESEVRFVLHKVDFIDTLDGLALQYGVSKQAIRKYNNLEGENIYYLKELRIPNPSQTENYTSEYDTEELEKIRQKQKLSVLESQLPLEDRKQARYYLEECNWDTALALRQYESEIAFEKQYEANQIKKFGGMYKKIN